MSKSKSKKSDNHDHDIDGCCIRLAEDECTPDHELPIAKGGLEVKGADNLLVDVNEDLDGCCGWYDVGGEITRDSELPKSRGGVA